MLPRDFDILFSSNSNQPCATIAFGTGSPAAIRNAGQYTQWNRTISLPIICTSAGQYFLNASCAPACDEPYPMAVM